MAVVTNPFVREQPAAAKAAVIARRSGARLVLFNTFMIPQPMSDVPMGSPHEEFIASAIRQRQERLERLASAMRVRRAARAVVRWDYPIHEAIVREVLKTKPDLLVTESHRHGRLARLLLANTDWELMRSCPCPLWFVRSSKLPRSPEVLVAVDPRHTHAKPARLDDRLMFAARALTNQLGGRVSIVHAYETPASAVPSMLMEPVRLPISPRRTRELVEKTARDVSRLAAKHRVEASDCFVQEGAAADVIAALAQRRRADVLVMGVVSRGMLVRPVIGGTAERVIDHVDCDIFVVKPANFRTPAKDWSARVPVRRNAARAAAAGV